MNEFDKCLKDRRLVRFEASPEMIEKEMDSAEYDLLKSEKSLLDGDYKWSSVQAYYSMFHAAKALVFLKGYREKSHYCLMIALRELYVRTGLIKDEFAENFELCMEIRHEADYALLYDEESAKMAFENAARFLEKAKKFLD